MGNEEGSNYDGWLVIIKGAWYVRSGEGFCMSMLCYVHTGMNAMLRGMQDAVFGMRYVGRGGG